MGALEPRTFATPNANLSVSNLTHHVFTPNQKANHV